MNAPICLFLLIPFPPTHAHAHTHTHTLTTTHTHTLSHNNTQTRTAQPFLPLLETERGELNWSKRGLTREETFCCLIMTGAPSSTLSPCCCQAGLSERAAADLEPCKIHHKAHDHVCLALTLACFASHETLVVYCSSGNGAFRPG